MPTLNANSNLAEWGFPMNGYMFIADLKSFYRLAAGFCNIAGQAIRIRGIALLPQLSQLQNVTNLQYNP